MSKKNTSMTTDMEHQKNGLEDDMTVNFQWISHKLVSILIFWGISPNSPIVRRDKTWATLETRRNGLGTKISGSLACGCQDVFGSRVWPLNIVQPCFLDGFLVGRHTDSTGKCWGMSMEIWDISMRALILGVSSKVLRGEKVDFEDPTILCHNRAKSWKLQVPRQVPRYR